MNDQGERSPYSERGSNLWVCAPSTDTARDPRQGITTTGNDDVYVDKFGGTSASTPIVSGVVALVRSVDTDLTWRDVKLILAASARKNDADNTGWEDGALKYGSTTERYHFSHEYGFGVVDAKAAVDLADGWTPAAHVRESGRRLGHQSQPEYPRLPRRRVPRQHRQHPGQQHPHHGF